MKRYLAYSVYLSLAFLLVALVRQGGLAVPASVDYAFLTAALVLVLAGFAVNGLSWSTLLGLGGARVPVSVAYASLGLSVFGKYIPGKVWAIVGRSVYVSERTELRGAVVTSLSVDAQLITLWTGLALGGGALLFSAELRGVGGLITLLWLALSLTLFSALCHHAVSRLVGLVLRREVHIPRLSAARVLRVVPYHVGVWLLWSAGFLCLAGALSTLPIPWTLAFAFPLATSIGIVAIIAPGGVGIREGVLVGYLSSQGLPLELATTIAVASRVWFLVGEVGIFVVGWLCHRGVAGDS